jgi:hypothetical protein
LHTNHRNVVLAYHGTSPESSEIILEPSKATAERFLISENDTDWLGNGVYFFQDAPYRAEEWPRIRQPPPRRTLNPVVLCAEIDLADCLDLIDIKAAKEIMYWYPQMKIDFHRTKRSLPKNTGGKRNLDRALINYAVQQMEKRGRRINTVRAAFTEGWSIVPGSKLYSHAHVQIVVRPYRTEVIKDVWLHRFNQGENNGH